MFVAIVGFLFLLSVCVGVKPRLSVPQLPVPPPFAGSAVAVTPSDELALSVERIPLPRPPETRAVEAVSRRRRGVHKRARATKSVFYCMLGLHVACGSVLELWRGVLQLAPPPGERERWKPTREDNGCEA